jgi:hypothetical protein
MVATNLEIDHEEGHVIIKADDKKIARIPGEDAVKLGLKILDEASESLKKSGQLAEE